MGHVHSDHHHDDHDHKGHHDHHGHSHGAGHHHHHLPAQQGKAFFLAVAMNTVFVGVEAFYGFMVDSTALLSDAGHNLSDVMGLLLAWGAVILARRKSGPLYTYGYRNSSILASLANAILLLLACGMMMWEIAHRISAPPVVAGATVMVVAAIGMVINGFSAWLFMKGSQSDLNIRGAYLHMAADAGVSLGVVVVGGLMMLTGWYWLDPLISLLIVGVIVWSTWGLLRDSFRLSMSAVPAGIQLTHVRDYLKSCHGVEDVHDLHVWGLSTTENALTVHLVMPSGHPGDAFMAELEQNLKQRFSIGHCTVQIECSMTASHHRCSLDEDDDSDDDKTAPNRVDHLSHHHAHRH